MVRTYLSTEAVVLRTTPYRDSDQIVTLFTANAGLIKILCYGSRNQKSKWRSLCDPLKRLEVVYREKAGEIFECRDLSLIDSYDSIKKHFRHIEAACDLLNALFISQMPGREAPDLFTLLTFFLKKIPEIENPWILAITFRLKLLKYEGLLTCPFFCQECREPLLQNGYFSEGRWLCAKDRHSISLHFSGQELQLLYRLVSSQKYGNLVDVPLTIDLKAKIDRFFYAFWREK